VGLLHNTYWSILTSRHVETMSGFEPLSSLLMISSNTEK
jgi:hypothetical protein